MAKRPGSKSSRSERKAGRERAQRARRETAQGDAGSRDEGRLESPVAAQPAQLGRLRVGAERSCDGERRVDVSARPSRRDQQSVA